MKKRTRRVVIIVVIGIVVAGIASAVYFGSQERPIVYTTVAVEKTDLMQTVEATGSVASAEALELSFKGSGNVSAVRVAVGDEVTAGELLATIRSDELNSQVSHARAALESAQADLDKLIAGATPTAIAVSTAKVSQARVAADAAASALANAQASAEKTHASYRDSALQALQDATFVASFTLHTVYDGILDTDADVSFKTTQSLSLQSAAVFHDIAESTLARAGEELSDAEQSRDDNDILKSLRSMRSALESTNKLLDESFTALAGAIATTSFTQATIDSLKSSFNTRATAIASAKTSIQNSIDQLTTGVQSLETSVDDAAFAAQKAVQALRLAEAELAQLTAEPQEYDIRQQEARVLQVQADLDAAQSKLSDATILAPVSGVITAVEIEVGEVVSSSKVAVTMIGDSRLKIDVDVPESDINKIQLDQNAVITLDAFGSDRTFSGHVAFIEPSERVIQDVVYYRVTIAFDDESEVVKPGMTADVTIATAERMGVLTVPLRAVTLSVDGGRTVRILIDETVETRSVSVGIRGDNGTVEVLSGLDEGDRVITGESNG